MAPLARSLFLYLGLSGLALSVPTSIRDNIQTIPYQPSRFSYHAQKTSSSWTQLRDSLIHKIWGSPPSREGRAYQGPDSAAIYARYGRDLVLRFKIETADEARALAEAADTLYLDIWEATKEWVDIRVAKDAIQPLLGLLPSSLHDAHSPLIQDLAQAILETYPSDILLQPTLPSFHAYEDITTHVNHASPTVTQELFFKDYQPLSVIGPWMRLMASLFPSHVQLISVGTSFEGRDIPALRIGARPQTEADPTKRRETILISGGSHAREWISTAAVNFVAYSLISHYGKVGLVTKILEEFDWVLVPTLNPDGYAYTWDQDRLWRKNRQKTNIPYCPGIDLGRSYEFGWDGDTTLNNPCLENYAGEAPFAGVEAHGFAQWARNETDNNNVQFSAFLDLHSYSQEVLYPYSFSCDQMPPTLENLEELALGLTKAIRLTHGQSYAVMSACEGSTVASHKSNTTIWPKMEPNGGSALDWFYQELQVKYTYQIKLRDTGSYGFLLPSSNILPTGQEMYSAVLELGKFLLSNKGIELAAQGEGGSHAMLTRPNKEQSEGEVDDAHDENVDDQSSGLELRRRRSRK